MSIEQTGETWLSKYKELIVTTIICLFLTGIYDSLNTQNEKIDKWYKVMIELQGDVTNNMGNIDRLRGRVDGHDGRIRELEIEVSPWASHKQKEDTTDVEDS